MLVWFTALGSDYTPPVPPVKVGLRLRLVAQLLRLNATASSRRLERKSLTSNLNIKGNKVERRGEMEVGSAEGTVKCDVHCD